MLRELRERIQQLMDSAAVQRDCGSSVAQEAALAKAQAASEDIRRELQSLKVDRQAVRDPSNPVPTHSPSVI